MGAEEKSQETVGRIRRILYYVGNLIGALIWQICTLLAKVVDVATRIVISIRAHYYDPKISHKTKCPACGHRDCNLKFIRTQGIERGTVQCTCTTCWAVFYQPLMVPAEKWLVNNGE